MKNESSSRNSSNPTVRHDILTSKEDPITRQFAAFRTTEKTVSPLRTIVQHRRIDIAAPEEIPDGTEVEVRVVTMDDSNGLSESQWDDSPSGTSAWMKWLDSLQPLTLTEQESQQLAADRDRQRRWELDQFAKHAEQLKCDWE